ncbi:hypothetical protein SAMN05877838_3791 [Hoeflea halophila]|uniref:Uncharacterized protein n=1 Tax=Hoeflea halophila TaxID=714899 RepID=A0A286IFP6_9HYPH|nr:hypothetical protein [Hoeflea halophila]SOE18847.1 hypothetical protein SAMN05877838_3791 [Hoeflea halophila]
MLIRTLAPLVIQIGSFNTTLPAGDIERAPPAIGRALVNAGHATRELEVPAGWAGDKPAPVTITDLALEDASAFGDSVRIAASRRVTASTYTIGTAPTLANQRDLIRLSSRAEWVPVTVAAEIIAAGAGERVPWFVDKATAFDHAADPVEVWAEDTPTDPHRARLGNDPAASVHPWSADNGEFV